MRRKLMFANYAYEYAMPCRNTLPAAMMIGGSQDRKGLGKDTADISGEHIIPQRFEALG